jgi:pimeloyl-ACP methyl ester carboxylesterase
MTASRVTRDGAVVHDLTVGGAEAYLVEPAGGGSGAAVLFFHWLDTEAPDGNRTQFLDEAAALAREHGVVSLLPQGQFPWSGPPTDAERDVARIRAEVDRHRAALDLLVGRDDVEAGRIALVGHDYGGMHGLLLAAGDERIAGVVLVAVTPRWGDWNLAFFPVAGDRFDYLRALAPYDPVTRIGDLAPRPVWLQFARNDFYIAPMGGWELHRAAGDPKEMVAYDADHGVRHADARTDRERFLGELLGWG